MNTLTQLGWTPHFADQLGADDLQRRVPARVAAQESNRYLLHYEHGELWAVVAGRLRQTALAPSDLPVVGDWVLVRPPSGDLGRIDRVLERTTLVRRKRVGERTCVEQPIVANLDHLLIVTSLNSELNLRRTERYLALARESGTPPVVLLNKSDLCAEPAEVLARVAGIAAGAPLHAISALAGAGLEQLAPYLGAGRTVAVVGSSGVGKSTLLNRLLGAEVVATREIRTDDDRGRHETTRRTLFRLPDGTLFIDTPGMRELHLWDAGEDLGGTYDDVDALARDCRFRDCEHVDEPGCAVRAAIDGGRLESGRLEGRRRMEREMIALNARRDPHAMREARKERKRRGKMYRKVAKQRRQARGL